MIVAMPGFALIGRSYPSDSFETLYRKSVAARQERRPGAWDAAVRSRPVWRGSGEAVTPPQSL